MGASSYPATFVTDRTRMKVAIIFLTAVTACGVILITQRPRADEAPPTKAEFAKGEALFDQICSHCHGPHMVNPGDVSFDLRKFPHDDRARFFNSVRNGKDGMPPWKDILKPDEIEAVWAYVRTGGKEP
jgi:mono/diheme cytochrome c family protein